MSAVGKAVVGGAAPPSAVDVNNPVEVGRRAWARRQADVGASWEDWKLVGFALLEGRKLAMTKANKNRPTGKKYNDAFHRWCVANGFGDMQKDDRAKLLSLMGDLDRIERWRSGLTETQRQQWNHPSTVWRISRCKSRGIHAAGEAAKGAPSDQTKTLEEIDEEKAERAWQEGLLLRARKAIGEARMSGIWVFAHAPDAGLISTVEKAAQAWSDLATYLRSIENATPDQLEESRQSYLEGETLRRDFARRKAERQAT